MTKEELLKYTEYIAIRYYGKHFRVFEKDAISLDDLKQEAKLICLKMYRKYNKQHKINNFDIKKFTGRAVGWRLGDLLKGAIIHDNNMSRYEDMAHHKNNYNVNGEDVDASDAVSVDTISRWNNSSGKNPNDDFYSTLSGSTQFGFAVKDVLIHFKGKSLIILKKLLENKSIVTIQKEMGYKNNYSIITIINNKIRPKVEEVLKKQLSEIRSQSI
jgi:hypothetical protein